MAARIEGEDLLYREGLGRTLNALQDSFAAQSEGEAGGSPGRVGRSGPQGRHNEPQRNRWMHQVTAQPLDARAVPPLHADVIRHP